MTNQSEVISMMDSIRKSYAEALAVSQGRRPGNRYVAEGEMNAYKKSMDLVEVLIELSQKGLDKAAQLNGLFKIQELLRNQSKTPLVAADARKEALVKLHEIYFMIEEEISFEDVTKINSRLTWLIDEVSKGES